MGAKGTAAVEEALQQFDLADVADTAPASLPLGIRQRLQLAAACLHHPEVLILDEPTSGVDPAARDMFWRHLLKLSREDKITIFVSTHFMNEAARCDRISFMHKGRVLAVGTPAELAARQNAPDLEEAFVQYLIEAESDNGHSEQGSLGQDPTIPSDSASWVSTQPTAKAADISDDLRSEERHEQNARSSESEQSEFRKNTDGVYFEQGRLGQDPTALSWVSTQHTATEFSDDLQGKDTGSSETQNDVREPSSHTLRDNPNTQNFKYRFSMIWTFARREAKELLRDKIRLFFAVFGPLIIMASVSWGISFDVRNLKFAVYDRDQTAASRELVEYFDGSRYFLQQPPIQSEAEIDTVLKSSGAILVIDIPSGFGRDLARGLKPEVGFYVDGSMPFNATNIRGYIGSLITAYTKDRIAESGLPVSLKAPAGIEPRFMYNQDFDSINAIAPGVMMLVLMMIPAMMSAVGVVREREIGSIANFYASPAAVAQYLARRRGAISDRQAASLYRRRHGQFRRHDADDYLPVRRAAQRLVCRTCRRHALDGVRQHRAGAFDFLLRALPACRHLRHRHHHHDPRANLFRLSLPAVHHGRRRADYRQNLPVVVVLHRQRRQLHQRAAHRRPAA